MRQKIIRFLSDLAATYRISDENYERVINDTTDYLMRNLPNYEIDFSKVKDAVFDKYRPKSKVFPEPYFLKDCLPYGKVWSYRASQEEGCLVVIEIPNKTIYSFEVCGTGKNIEDIKKEIAKNHGNSKVTIYPKGSVLIGNKVITG